MVAVPPVNGVPEIVRPGADAAPLALKMSAALKVSAVASPATVSEPDGNVMVVLSVPASVRLLLTVSVLLFAIVSVAAVAGAVTVTLLIVVAVAAPIFGVVSVGEVAKKRQARNPSHP